MAIYLYRRRQYGLCDSASEYGDFYQEGHSAIEKNSYQAMYWYKRAAQQNNIAAQLAIAKPMSKVMALVKISEAFLWYERAAQNKSQEAGMKVAEFYEKG